MFLLCGSSFCISSGPCFLLFKPKQWDSIWTSESLIPNVWHQHLLRALLNKQDFLCSQLWLTLTTPKHMPLNKGGLKTTFHQTKPVRHKKKGSSLPLESFITSVPSSTTCLVLQLGCGWLLQKLKQWTMRSETSADLRVKIKKTRDSRPICLSWSEAEMHLVNHSYPLILSRTELQIWNLVGGFNPSSQLGSSLQVEVKIRHILTPPPSIHVVIYQDLVNNWRIDLIWMLMLCQCTQ